MAEGISYWRWTLSGLFTNDCCLESPRLISMALQSCYWLKVQQCNRTLLCLGNIISHSDRNLDAVECWGQSWVRITQVMRRRFLFALVGTRANGFVSSFFAHFVPATAVFLRFLSCPALLAGITCFEMTSSHSETLPARVHMWERRGASLWLTQLSLWLQRPWPSQQWGLASFSLFLFLSLSCTDPSTSVLFLF